MHSTARFYDHFPSLYGKYIQQGLPWTANRGRLGHRGGYETDFKTIQRSLTQPNNPKAMARCAKSVGLWTIQLQRELDLSLPQRDVNGNPVDRPLHEHPLVKNLTFVQTVLCAYGYSKPLPLQEPLFSAVKERQTLSLGAVDTQLKLFAPDLPQGKQVIAFVELKT